MPRPLLLALRVLGLLVLAGVAHGRLLGAGWRAPDLRLFERALAVDAHSNQELAEADPYGAPLSTLERVGWARHGAWRGDVRPALWQRAEALVLLLGAALGLGLYARRLLLPWTGAEHAGAAMLAAAALAATHPAGTALIADPAGADELRALCLSAFAAWLFLFGRQERRPLWTAAAFPLTLAAALCGELAWALPVVLALSELVSARRHRPRRERWRTALNTLLIFGLAAAVAPVLWLGHGGASRFASGLAFATAEPAAAARLMLERAGLLLLPAHPSATGVAGMLAAGVVLVLGLQPALVAARSAPRLWSRMLGAWLVLLACGLVYALDVPVQAGAATHSALLAGGAFACVLGLSTAGTALSGFLRAAFPWIGAAVYAALAWAGAGAWSGAAGATMELRRDLAAARARFGAGSPLLVLDVPASVGGVETLGGAVGALSDPAALAGAEAAQDAPILLSAEAFKALAREPELGALRAAQAVVLVPLDALPASQAEPALRTDGRRLAVRLGTPPAADPQDPDRGHSWRGLGGSRSPDLDVDTLSYPMLVVSVDPRTDAALERRAAWRTTGHGVAGGTQRGAWIQTADGPVLVVELGDSLAWLLGDRARSVWIEGGATSVTQAELLRAPPPFEGEVKAQPDGDDWTFPRATTLLVQAAGERGSYVLTLLSLKDHALRSIPAERDGEDRLRAAGAARAVAELERPVAWSLEFRVEDVPLARAAGRRVGRAGTVEGGAAEDH